MFERQEYTGEFVTIDGQDYEILVSLKIYRVGSEKIAFALDGISGVTIWTGSDVEIHKNDTLEQYKTKIIEVLTTP